MSGAIGRRDLFRLGGQAFRRAGSWIRPPFAHDELEFLARCTRCDKCIDACPHDVLFALRTEVGRHAAGTPAMDLLRHGCHMCDGWPCVAACAPGALALPEGETAPPKFAAARIDPAVCLPYSGPECGACAGSCPVPGALNWDGGVRPVIDAEHCTGCGLCREACIADPKAVQITALDSD